MKVVIADGHSITRLGLKDLLIKAEEIEIAGECEDSEALLSFAETSCLDLIILGTNLKGRNADEVCRLIKTLPKAPYVLIYTAHDFAEDLPSYVLAGADSYLSAPNITAARSASRSEHTRD